MEAMKTFDGNYQELIADATLQARILRAEKQLALYGGESKIRQRALESLSQKMAPRLMKTEEIKPAEKVLVVSDDVLAGYFRHAEEAGLQAPKLIDGEVLPDEAEGDS